MTQLDFSKTERLQEVAQTWRKIDAALKKVRRLDKDPVANLEKIQAEVRLIETLGEDLRADRLDEDVVSQAVQTLTPQITKVRTVVADQFAGQFHQALQENSLGLSGHMPELKCWRFTIDVDVEVLVAKLWWGPKEELLEQMPLDPGKWAKTLSAIKTRIEKQSADTGKTAKILNAAYSGTCARNRATPGEQVPITEVMNEIAFQTQSSSFRNSPVREAFSSYPRSQFSNDIATLRDVWKPGYLIKLKGATRAFTDSKSRSIWIPGDDQGRGEWFSHISIETESNA